MSKEKDDILFEERLAEKRHRELLVSLKVIAEELKKEKPNTQIISAIGEHIKSIEKFSGVLSNLSKPEVNIDVKQDEVIKAVVESKKEISGKIDTLNQTLLALIEMQMKEREFKIRRNNYGSLDSISVTVKN